MSEDWGMPEQFGAIYEVPAGEACPECPCCTRRLCEAGRKVVGGCNSAAAGGDRDLVANCTCGVGAGSETAVWQEREAVRRAERKARMTKGSTTQ
ncbi:hypothetical protein ABZX65_26910 [Streptomyces sp. NPDC003300]|uniref:hypothetical protein n=1 Tax=unclassified Streptomyces TaxID=2593676 RepID=UPI0033B701DB